MQGTVSADQEIATAVVQTNTPPSEAGHKAWNLAMIQCRRKLRHENYWTAVQHALHLGRDVRTYLCPVCEGIHCGNPPGSELTRQYRRARKRWRVIERRLVALDAEWAALVREKKVLLRQIGNGDVVLSRAEQKGTTTARERWFVVYFCSAAYKRNGGLQFQEHFEMSFFISESERKLNDSTRPDVLHRL